MARGEGGFEDVMVEQVEESAGDEIERYCCEKCGESEIEVIVEKREISEEDEGGEHVTWMAEMVAGLVQFLLDSAHLLSV